MNIVYYVAAAALSIPLVKTFWKAGNFKRTAPIETMVAAGMGWTGDAPKGIVRLVGYLELLGVIGLVLGQVAAWFPVFAWAHTYAALAAAGLSLTMIVAALLHTVRKEIKYTWKMNLGLAAIAALAAVALFLAA